MTELSVASNTSANTRTWNDILKGEKSKPYFKELISFVEAERCSGKQIYPPNKNVFEALAATSFKNVKVVIIGQDPYHGAGQAHGLCFSVKPGVQAPPSLQNIFRELKSDLNLPTPSTGCLSAWAAQGVLLLNSVLTVESGQPQSHSNRGWETFTDAIVAALNEYHSSLVFMLWGAPAQKKCLGIDFHRHHLLKAPHPSPLSAHRGFLGCKHFSSCNQLLITSGKRPINWAI